MTMFSFHPVKHITTGEGGMITTNQKSLYDKLKSFRTHGLQEIQTDGCIMIIHGITRCKILALIIE